MILIIIKWVLHNISHGIMRILLSLMFLLINSLFFITLFPMVLTCTAIHYPIKSASILVIWGGGAY